MRYREISEGKWWDDTDTITLYHGTSSALVQHIREHGLRPPKLDILEYALDVLEAYIDKSEWTDDLIREVKDHAVRAQAGRAGDRGAVIYAFTERDAVAGYAESYAKHGGEIAADVYNVACRFRAGDVSIRELKTNPPFRPRYDDAHPVIVTMEVPKAWCLFEQEPEMTKSHIRRARDEGKSWALDGTIEQVFDEIYDQREIRITKTVPMSMIRDISPSDSSRLDERFETVEWPSNQIPDLKYWSNPRLSEIQRALAGSRGQCLRGLASRETGKSYIWDAYAASHEDFADLIGIELDEGETFSSLIAPSEEILTSESDWSFGGIYRTEKGNLYVQVIDETYFAFTEAFGEHFFVKKIRG